MKDNTYHLQRHMWNDVSEDWQFYSEQERQCMKRRKPQNLTPPCSDGSTSSSGHSPAQSSHHNMPSPPREEEQLFLESDIFNVLFNMRATDRTRCNRFTYRVLYINLV